MHILCVDAARNFVGDFFLNLCLDTKNSFFQYWYCWCLYTLHSLNFHYEVIIFEEFFSSFHGKLFCLSGQTCQGDDKFKPLTSADLDFLPILDRHCPRHLLPLIILICYYRDFNFRIKVNEDFFFLRNILKDIIFRSTCMDDAYVIVTRLFDTFCFCLNVSRCRKGVGFSLGTNFWYCLF